MVNNVNWSRLPDDLLTRIVENHLPSVDDVIVFSSVCNSWNRASRACDKFQLRKTGVCQMPWLMLTDGNDDELYSDTGSYKSHMLDNYIGLSEDERRLYYTYSDEDEPEPEPESVDFDRLSVDSYYYSNIGDVKRKSLNLSQDRNKCYNLSLPEFYGKACWGSRYGWVVTLGLNREMHLFNPLTQAQLPLPSQTTFRYPWKRARDKTVRLMFLTKVVVLKVTEDNNDASSWLVVAIYCINSAVAIARPGDGSWMHISNDYDPIHFMDVIYSDKLKSLLFVREEDLSLFYYDVHNPEQPQTIKEYMEGPTFIPDDVPKNVEPSMNDEPYLVQLGDDLLVIVRRVRHHLRYYFSDFHHGYMTLNFMVFRYSFSEGNWDELSDMGDIAVFVGSSETTCVVASEAGCKRNCIYFSDVRNLEFRENRDKLGGHDTGVFDLGNKKFESIYDGIHSKSSYCSPFWFSPSML